jgi:hypothetical protein
MIRLDLSVILLIYFSLSTVALLLAWLYLDTTRKKKPEEKGEPFIWHCTICDYNYIDSLSDTISRCPRCGSFNEKATH